MIAKSPYTIDSMHSVAYRICVFMFANVLCKGHFVNAKTVVQT